MSVFFLSAAPLWPTLLADYTGFSKQDIVPLSVLLYVKWYVSACVCVCVYAKLNSLTSRHVRFTECDIKWHQSSRDLHILNASDHKLQV